MAQRLGLDDASIKAVVHSGILRLYKRLLEGNRDDQLSDEEIIYRTGLPSPTDLLRRRRLRYLGSLHALGMSAFWGLINHDAQWLFLIKDDLIWLWSHLHNSCDHGRPSFPLAALARDFDLAPWLLASTSTTS